MVTTLNPLDTCVVAASKKRHHGNQFWVAQVYRPGGVGRWHCFHQHLSRDTAIICAQQNHHAIHGR